VCAHCRHSEATGQYPAERGDAGRWRLTRKDEPSPSAALRDGDGGGPGLDGSMRELAPPPYLAVVEWGSSHPSGAGMSSASGTVLFRSAIGSLPSFSFLLSPWSPPLWTAALHNHLRARPTLLADSAPPRFATARMRRRTSVAEEGERVHSRTGVRNRRKNM